MEIEKSKVSIQFLLIFRQSGDVLFSHYARRFRGYTATDILVERPDSILQLCAGIRFKSVPCVAKRRLTAVFLLAS